MLFEKLGIDEFEKKKLKIKDEEKVKKRLKREVKHNYPYIIERNVYLELLVVVDKKMEDYYGENLENHVLTLLFMVIFFFNLFHSIFIYLYILQEI